MLKSSKIYKTNCILMKLIRAGEAQDPARSKMAMREMRESEKFVTDVKVVCISLKL